MDPNKSHDTSSNGGASNASTSNTANTTNHNGQREPKRQHYNNKQRMDIYAFCVLELEMHSNKVSIKKQQQAIQKVLNEQQQQQQKGCQNSHHHQSMNNSNNNISSSSSNNNSQLNPPYLPAPAQEQQQSFIQSQPHQETSASLNQSAQMSASTSSSSSSLATDTNQQQQQQLVVVQSDQNHSHRQSAHLQNGTGEPQGSLHNDSNASSNQSSSEGKTLLQLQQEVAMTRRCYSDYQRTQVLTSSMLRDVQKRFAKYYPDSAIPSRTTVKHVFEKCVAHGTVENMRTPRKARKLPQGDEIEHLLIHEPQLSLRQLAQRLNVSTGTISRRCKALGLMPESVSIKHQQLASARRQKQIKQLESQSKMQAIEPATNGNGPTQMETR